MRYINLAMLQQNLEAIRSDFNSKKHFRYTVIENLLSGPAAEKIYESYPSIQDGLWDGTTYINQKNKFQKTEFEEGSPMAGIFRELNCPEFLLWLGQVTGIEEMLPDQDLFGGGLHQSINGAFLNVHVDYNIHPKTNYHRRLNVLIYMNKDWKDEYEGHLELWNITDDSQELLEKISPDFNRCVIFETNELSFHGHPKPLKTPPGINRKSIATYYYTKGRPAKETASAHNTIYVNTEGVKGQAKKLSSGVKAFLERINKK
ncbi:MAG: 2OG-Fe(II) oxygenase [Bacteroidia bacterium]